jgi:hypothetical protein
MDERVRRRELPAVLLIVGVYANVRGGAMVKPMKRKKWWESKEEAKNRSGIESMLMALQNIYFKLRRRTRFLKYTSIVRVLKAAQSMSFH